MFRLKSMLLATRVNPPKPAKPTFAFERHILISMRDSLTMFSIFNNSTLGSVRTRK